MKSRKSRLFSGLLGGYPENTQGPSSRIQEAEAEEVEESVKMKELKETEVAAALEGSPEVPTLAFSNQPLVSKADTNIHKMMEQMTKFMGQLTQEVAPRENLRAPEFKTPSMKAHDSFDGTQAHKLRGFIQSCQLIFHNYPENFSDRNKALY
ncbi:hypothetical protein O181_039887 [Austropuccinia psidii MF-1]|uniref:Uncharacterized protein n=1 Tax=Austropuccinia psidii MF-1 TaxID=1389203 RepID=A0A9Q3HDB9_9BASI|nr:hypothetical protein [Austropuccinia psidii MF-1]